MIQEIDPTQTKRAAAFSLWMHAPMPMITLFKTLDVTPLVRYSRRTGCKFHMLLCWCIGRAASQTEAFYLLPVDQKLIQYDKLAISTVVPTADHAISTFDIPFSTDLSQFQQDYLNLTRRVHDTGEAYNLAEEYMVIGTSALSQYDIDGAVNLYAGFYNNPFLIWGKYKKGFLKRTLLLSFQFHHTQLDGVPAAQFLSRLQQEIQTIQKASIVPKSPKG